jgi:hypothetical protein
MNLKLIDLFQYIKNNRIKNVSGLKDATINVSIQHDSVCLIPFIIRELNIKSFNDYMAFLDLFNIETVKYESVAFIPPLVDMPLSNDELFSLLTMFDYSSEPAVVSLIPFLEKLTNTQNLSLMLNIRHSHTLFEFWISNLNGELTETINFNNMKECWIAHDYFLIREMLSKNIFRNKLLIDSIFEIKSIYKEADITIIQNEFADAFLRGIVSYLNDTPEWNSLHIEKILKVLSDDSIHINGATKWKYLTNFYISILNNKSKFTDKINLFAKNELNKLIIKNLRDITFNPM